MTNLELKQARDTAAKKCIDLFAEVKNSGVFLKQPLLELQLLGQVHGLMCKQLDAEKEEVLNYGNHIAIAIEFLESWIQHHPGDGPIIHAQIEVLRKLEAYAEGGGE